MLRDQGAGPEASGLEEDLLAECGTRVLKTVTFTLHPSPYTMPPTPYTLHPRPYTLHSTPCTLHPTPFTQDPTPCTLHPAPYTLHPTPYTLHVLTTVRLAPHALTPDTVELIPTLGALFPRGGPVQDPVLTVPHTVADLHRDLRHPREPWISSGHVIDFISVLPGAWSHAGFNLSI